MANREMFDNNNVILKQYLPNPYPYPVVSTPAPLSAVLATGNTSGANHIIMDAGQNVDVTGGEVFTATLNVNTIEPLAPAISTDIGIVGSLVFPGPIEMRNDAAGGGAGLTIDSIPSASVPNANVLGYNTLTHQITYQPASSGGGENLAQTLALGNTSGVNDILMDSGQKISVETITDTQTITGSPITGDITVKSVSSNESLKISNVTRTANLSANFGSRVFQHYTDSFTQKVGITFQDLPIGVNRKIEVGTDIAGAYTKLQGIQQSLPPQDWVVGFDNVNENVYYQPYINEQFIALEGNYTTQPDIPAPSSAFQKYIIRNKGIKQSFGIAWNDLTNLGTSSYIPFIRKDGQPEPSAFLSANTNPWGDNDTPINYIVRAIVPEPNSAIIYVGAYFSGANRSYVYRFDANSNQWETIAQVSDGIIHTMFYDSYVGNTGGRLYIGGSFNQTEGVNNIGAPTVSKNIVYYEINTGTTVNMPQFGLNGPVNCFERWQSFIAIGGDFNQDVVGTGFWYEYIALYDGSGFLNINQQNSGINNEWGFNSTVNSIIALPQTNTLIIGGRFNIEYANNVPLTYNNIVQFQPFNTFNGVGDGSLNGNVNRILRDTEEGRIYVAGDFSTSNGNHFVGLDINTFNAWYNFNYNLNSIGQFSNLTKDEIGGYIWMYNTNDNSICRFNPVPSPGIAYEDMTSLFGVSGKGNICYSPFDKAVHYGIDGNGYYRYYCDQRIKIDLEGNGALTENNGSLYGVVVLPKRGSSITLYGELNDPTRWYVSGPTPDVYYEWRKAQITPVENAFAIATLVEKQIGLTTFNVFWNNLNGKNIYLSSPNSNKIVVKQKGLYKMSFTIQWESNSGTTSAYAWFLVNSQRQQQSTAYEVLKHPDSMSCVNKEMMIELNPGDWVGVEIYTPDAGTLDLIGGQQSPTQNAVPAVQFNINKIESYTELYASLP